MTNLMVPPSFLSSPGAEEAQALRGRAAVNRRNNNVWEMRMGKTQTFYNQRKEKSSDSAADQETRESRGVSFLGMTFPGGTDIEDIHYC